MAPEELTAWLRLRLTDGIGNRASYQLLQRFGSPAAVFEQPAFVLRECVSATQAEALQEPPTALAVQVSHTQHWLAQTTPQCQRAVWPLGHSQYPEAFLLLPDPPLLVFAQGQLAWPLPPAVAVVGSRNPTPQGSQNAQQFAEALALAGLCVVSGLALGVDGAAHRGALRANQMQSLDVLRTVAVVGTGLDRVYPRQHHALAQAIAAHGWLLSEYPLGASALPHHFPQRNRLIAALGLGTLVVEAALQSGSLITAQMALAMGREVLALPGSIHSPQSRGCHALIKEGAKLVETAQDVLEELLSPGVMARAARLGRGDDGEDDGQGDGDGDGEGYGDGEDGGNNSNSSDDDTATAGDDTTDKPSRIRAGRPNATPQNLLDHLDHEPISLDALQTRCGWDTPTLLSTLLTLELEGSVARLPGGLFQRLSSL